MVRCEQTMVNGWGDCGLRVLRPRLPRVSLRALAALAMGEPKQATGERERTEKGGARNGGRRPLESFESSTERISVF